MNQCGVANSTGTDTPQFFRVLMMGEDDQGISNWEEGLQLHGCLVQVCRTYLEFMLFLEHEPFNLVVIFDGIANQPESQAAFLYLSEIRKGTPFMVIKPSECGGYPTPALGPPN